MKDNKRQLQGLRIGISISESPTLAQFGLSPQAVNSITVDLARRLLSLGATVVLGHNWRAGGVMEAVSKFAVAYRNQRGQPEHPLVRNYLAAPDQPSLSEAEKRDLAAFVKIETISWEDQKTEALALVRRPRMHRLQSLPSINVFSQDPDPRDAKEMRARHLLAMRCRLCLECDVRIVIGGRTSDYQGYAPGIVEELCWSVLANKPVLLSTALGGASLAAADIESEPAKRILDDKDHPMACQFLVMAHRGIVAGGKVEVTEDLRSDDIIPALSSLLHTHGTSN